MKKQTALNRFAKVLGHKEKHGLLSAVAGEMGISRQAVFRWPDPLPEKIEAKVRAVLAEKGS